MDLTALIVYVGWGALAFGWRSVVQWRRTGDSGLRLHAGPGTVQWWAKIGFVLALIAGLAAPIVGLTGVRPLAALDRAPVRWTGLVLALIGVASTLLAQMQMGASWRIGVDETERTTLVTGGIFAVVRNAIFTAMIVTATGLGLMVGNVIAVVGFVALVAALEAQVRLVEEPYLRTVHGATYERYASAAGRFLPGVGRLRGEHDTRAARF